MSNDPETTRDKVPAASPASRAIVYLRVSTEEQSESRLGLEAQAAACSIWAGRNGRAIAGPFADEGVSGASTLDQRPALVLAVTELRRGDVLIVAKRDRLGRDPIVTATIEAACSRKGCRVISAAGEGTDGDEPSDVLMRRIVDAFAEYERLLIKARTRGALDAKRRRGERIGTVPYGYDVAPDHKTLVPNEQQLRVIAWMRGRRLEGRSFREIAHELNERWVRPKRGARWRHSTIAGILSRAEVKHEGMQESALVAQ